MGRLGPSLRLKASAHRPMFTTTIGHHYEPHFSGAHAYAPSTQHATPSPTYLVGEDGRVGFAGGANRQAGSGVAESHRQARLGTTHRHAGDADTARKQLGETEGG